MHKKDNFIPALSYDWLTLFCDALITWTMPESKFKRQLIASASIRNNDRILDLGCGTATLTLLLKSICPDAIVIGTDGDGKILEIGRRKTIKAGLEITFVQGMAFNLPYSDASFDGVLSSLMFHHLTRNNKIRTLKEVNRVLRPGGGIHIADFGKPQNLLMRAAAYPWQLFDGSTTTADNVSGQLPRMIRDSGFVGVREQPLT